MKKFTLNTDVLAKMEEKELNSVYLKCRSMINKSKNGTRDKKVAEVDMCYILREMDIRKKRIDNYKRSYDRYDDMRRSRR